MNQNNGTETRATWGGYDDADGDDDTADDDDAADDDADDGGDEAVVFSFPPCVHMSIERYL